MAKRKPNIPRSQMSTFDPKNVRMTVTKIELPKREQEHEIRQLSDGCGDPSCPKCYPRDGRRPDGRSPFGFTSGEGSAFERSLREGLESFIMAEAFAPVRGRPGTDDRAYNEAREKVKKYLLTSEQEVGWDDVVGNEAARTALLEAIEHPAKYSEIYKFYGKKPLKGVLLFGPPGCGKTMFGKAAAAAISRLYGTKADLLKINGPEIQSPFVGVTEEIIRDIFKFARLYRAKHNHPLVVFIDEADSILPPRDATSASFHASNVAAFLAEMDGLEESGAFVMLATNRPDAIDPAILRDGRIDRRIRVERPTREAALSIITKAMQGAPLVGDLATLAEHACAAFYSEDHVLALVGRAAMVNQTATADFHAFRLQHVVNGAMLVGLVERAKGIAFRRDVTNETRTGLSADDLTQAVTDILTEARGTNHEAAVAEFLSAIPMRAAAQEKPGEIKRILQ
jgi:SpoVK/Ycf46/Vps4 family AAA+-type ATPase